MPKPGWLDQQPVRFGLLQQHIQTHLHRQAVDAAHTAAGDLFEHRAAVRQQRAVDADFAEFIDQYRPALMLGFMSQQMADGGGFTAAEEAGNQIGFGH